MSRKQIPVVTVFSISLMMMLGACNGRQLENVLRPNPDLDAPNSLGTESSESETDDTRSPGVQVTKRPKNDSQTATAKQSPTTQIVAELPDNLPFYPQATLDKITADSTTEVGSSIWFSSDEPSQIVSYYQKKWQDKDWQIVEPFTADTNSQGFTASVKKDDFQYDLLLLPVTQDGTNKSKLTIAYTDSGDSAFAIADKTEEVTAAQANPQVTDSSNQTITSNDQPANDSLESSLLSDLTEVPEPLQQYVADVAALNVVTFKAKTSDNKLQFQPSEIITRSQYAKWLVKANNKYYQNSPGNKIRVAAINSTPAFQDVTPQDPNFAEIQGLAEAGLIPSALTSDSTQVVFKPNAPLTREDLINWKVPLDIRKGLANADNNAIKETWGFQDLVKISPGVFPALFADYQNGDRSNIKRVFGYTTLFQPQKPVTRAEAAASLWHFGNPDVGITAPEILNPSN